MAEPPEPLGWRGQWPERARVRVEHPAAR